MTYINPICLNLYVHFLKEPEILFHYSKQFDEMVMVL